MNQKVSGSMLTGQPHNSGSSVRVSDSPAFLLWLQSGFHNSRCHILKEDISRQKAELLHVIEKEKSSHKPPENCPSHPCDWATRPSRGQGVEKESTCLSACCGWKQIWEEGIRTAWWVAIPTVMQSRHGNL